MEESNQLTTFMSNFSNVDKFIWGTYYDGTLGDEIKVSVLAAGFDTDSEIETKPEPQVKEQHSAEEKKSKEDEIDEKIKDTYGPTATQRFNAERQRIFLLKPEQIDDESILEMLENNPAYNRDKSVIDKFKNLSNANKEAEQASSSSLAAGSVISF